MKIGLVFTVLNNFKGFAEAVHSIKSENHWQPYVMDQWRVNKTLAKAWNDGAQMAFDDGCDYAIICNDDILFAPDCIDTMVAEYERLRDEKVVMVTPNNILMELADPLDILTYERDKSAPVGVSDHPNFSCFLIAPEYFEKVGKFDENFKPAWYEDNDAHRRAELLGYRLVSVSNALQVHFGGVSTAMIDNPDSSHSRDYYLKKWGGVPVSHPGNEPKEHFKTPYNDPKLTPKDWIPDYA